jgi:hypothetical protein
MEQSTKELTTLIESRYTFNILYGTIPKKKEYTMAKKDEQFSFKTTGTLLEKGKTDAEANSMSLASWICFLIANAKVEVKVPNPKSE